MTAAANTPDNSWVDLKYKHLFKIYFILFFQVLKKTILTLDFSTLGRRYAGQKQVGNFEFSKIIDDLFSFISKISKINDQMTEKK